MKDKNTIADSLITYQMGIDDNIENIIKLIEKEEKEQNNNRKKELNERMRQNELQNRFNNNQNNYIDNYFNNNNYNRQNSNYNRQNSNYNRQNSNYNRQNSNYNRQNSNYSNNFESDYLSISNLSYNDLLNLENRIGNVNVGLNQEEINNLNEGEYNIKLKKNNDLNNCIICLSDFVIGEKIRFLPCLHFFHTNCIDNWLKTKKNCPICNNQIQ